MTQRIYDKFLRQIFPSGYSTALQHQYWEAIVPVIGKLMNKADAGHEIDTITRRIRTVINSYMYEHTT